MPKTQYSVFTDGSASTHGCKAGGYAAIILRDDVLEKIVYGGHAQTTIGKMEMLAIITALEHIRELPDAFESDITVRCDRQDVVYSATGQYQRRANQEEWRRFDRAGKDLSLTIINIPRNSNEFSAQCDDLSGNIRLKIEGDPTRVITHLKS